MTEKSFYLVSLGCAKNTVDSASISQLLIENGYTQTDKPVSADLLIVNTCGFIQPARDEAIETLQKLARKKRRTQLLIAAGCMAQRYGSSLAKQINGLDGIIGTRRWMDMLEFVQQVRERKPPAPVFHIPETADSVGTDERGIMRTAIQGKSAYLKIADGCHRPCAFCSIPLIKGTTVSRPMPLILEEARTLQKAGIQELILIAQDTTAYGLDMGIKDGLPTLLENLSREIPQIPWIRILYTFPGFISDRLIDVMANSHQILHYLDIPLQHAHPDTLIRMKRPANMDWVYRTITKMRTAMPDLAIRTTFIAGYPGETEAEFNTLLEFVKEIRFDHVGVFPFYFEPGTSSEPLGDPVSSETKQSRVESLMLLQEDISQERNRTWIGRSLDMLVEGQNEQILVGRSYRDAPEIDGMVFAEGKAMTGEMIPVQITGAMPHDLIGHRIIPGA